MKTCKKCGETKPLTEFHKQRGGRDGLKAQCRACVRQMPTQRSDYQADYYRRNRERKLAESRAQYQDPEYRERKKQAAREWARSNPDRVRASQRRAWAKRKYGLTLEEVDAILARGCAICGTYEGRSVGKASATMGRAEDRLCLDHCHATGKARDALCHSCNTGLGSFADDPERLRAAADYLERHWEEVAA